MDEHDAVPLPKKYRIYETPQLAHTARTWRNNIVDFERGLWLRRTPFRWFLLLVFFMTFYLGVLLLASFNYLIFSYYLPTKHPRWVLEQPGLSVQPLFYSFRNSIPDIRYISNIYADIDRIVDVISKEHDKYGSPPKEYFQNCSLGNSYGYHSRMPCFFLKVNRVIKFSPITYTDVTEMPSFTPKDLISYIKKLPNTEQDSNVWLGCKMVPHVDLQYIPRPFVKADSLIYNSTVRYFGNATTTNGTDITNSEKHKTFFGKADFNRMIAVRPIKDLKENQEYDVRCFVFAKNIIIEEHSSLQRGTIRFKLEIVNRE